MDVEKIAGLLPEEPREGLLEWGINNAEAAPHLTLFRRESITITPAMRELMTYDDFEERERGIERHWGAVCRCTACGEEYIAGYHKGHVLLRGGEDGQLYDGWVAPEDDDWEINRYSEGSELICPLCGEQTFLTKYAALKNGRTHQVLIGSLEVMEGYTAIVGWLLRTFIDRDGSYTRSVLPREAVVIDERGRLHRFSHSSKGMYAVESQRENWAHRTRYADTFQSKYYSWEACCGNMVGGCVWPDVPDLTGTTGEKTGIAEYFIAGGHHLLVYLKTWQTKPQIENLLKAGMFHLLESGMDKDVNGILQYGGRKESGCALSFGNWGESKPHRILGVTRQEMEYVRRENWSAEKMCIFKRYRNIGEKGMVWEFSERLEDIGAGLMERIIEANEGGEADMTVDRVCRYIRTKTDCALHTGVGMLIDTRRMARELDEYEDLPEEMRWPRNLRAVHDRLSAQIESIQNAERNVALQGGFDTVLEKCGGLEWTDGDLCIRLPRGNGELIAEGRILRHCVGGHGPSHAEGQSIILFVRHHRRPERSYYTLNINVKGEPREIQLHGYGNERHGEHKEHSHRIPPKVRAFVDRWKEEVLMEWYRNQQKQRGKSPRKSKQKENAA